jgi:hypothetical protein
MIVVELAMAAIVLEKTPSNCELKHDTLMSHLRELLPSNYKPLVFIV